MFSRRHTSPRTFSRLPALCAAFALAFAFVLVPRPASADCAPTVPCLCPDTDEFGTDQPIHSALIDVIGSDVDGHFVRIVAIWSGRTAGTAPAQVGDEIWVLDESWHPLRQAYMPEAGRRALMAWSAGDEAEDGYLLYLLDRRDRVRCEQDCRFRMDAADAAQAILADAATCAALRDAAGYVEGDPGCLDVVTPMALPYILGHAAWCEYETSLRYGGVLGMIGLLGVFGWLQRRRVRSTRHE